MFLATQRVRERWIFIFVSRGTKQFHTVTRKPQEKPKASNVAINLATKKPGHEYSVNIKMSW